MNENQIQAELVTSIKSWGGYSRKVTDAVICDVCGKKIVPPSGRPDNYVTLGRQSCMIEVKWGGLSFPFSSFTEEQRDWGSWYVTERNGVYCVWLSMGKRINHNTHPRMTWLVPLRDFLAARVMVPQKSLPYSVDGRGYKKSMKGLSNGFLFPSLDAVHIFRNYELAWEGRGVWSLPDNHPLTEVMRCE